MSESQTPTGGLVRKSALFAVAILAFIMVFTGIGKSETAPFVPRAFEDVTIASSNDQGTVVVDNGGTTLLFLDTSGQLISMYGLDNGGAPINEVSYVYQSEKNVFVAGVKRATDGESITTEGVLLFDIEGEYIMPVWQRDYEDDEVQVSPSVASVTCDAEGHPIMCLFDDDEYHSVDFGMSVVKVGVDGSEDQTLREGLMVPESCIYDARYSAEHDRCLISDAYGTLYTEQGESRQLVPMDAEGTPHIIETFDAQGDVGVFYDKSRQVLVKADDLFGAPRFSDIQTLVSCSSVTLSDGKATVTTDPKTVRVFDLSSGSSYDLTKAPLVPLLNLRTFALVASRVYLAVFCIACIIRWFIRAMREGRTARIRNAIVAVGIAFVFLAGLVAHTLTVYDTTIEARQRTVAQIALQTCVTSPAGFGDAVTQEVRRVRGELSFDGAQEDFATMALNVEGILLSSFKNGTGVQCALYSIPDGDGPVLHLFSNQGGSVVASPETDEEVTEAVNAIVAQANEAQGSGATKALAFAGKDAMASIAHRKGSSNVISCVAPLFAEDGTCVSAIEVSYHMESLQRTLASKILNMILSFVMVAAAVYVIAEEAIRSGRAILRYRRLHAEGADWSVTLLGRPLIFVTTLAFSLDAALAVVIAKDMLTGTGMDSIAFVTGIPALAITLGTTVGTIAHSYLSSRVPARAFVVPTLILTIMAEGACALAVLNASFLIFVVGKFFAAAGLAEIVFVANNLAGNTAGKDVGSEEISLLVGRSSVGLSAKGAQVVAGVLGAFLALSGTHMLYVASAILGLAVFPILLLALPRGHVISSHGDQANLSNAFHFVLSPIMLTTLFFGLLPTALASGYRSYILPLLLATEGVSKSDISNLFALGNVILYALSEALITRRNATGRWVTTWCGLIGLGVVFVLFSNNQTPTWAVCAVVVISVLAWLAGDWKYLARGWAKEDHDFAYDQSQALLNVEESLVKNVQPGVLSGLLTLGAAFCCFVLGIYFAVSGSAYFLLTRKRRPS